MALGTNLKEILKQKNMSIKDLSKKTGISLNTLYSITKRDGRMARFDIIKKICETLEITESELLGFDVKPDGLITTKGTQQDIVSFFSGVDKLVETAMDPLRYEYLSNFDKLNDKGKEKAIEQVELLTKIPEYKKDPGNDNQDQE